MMFAEIAANPAALPLWGVFVFAALMYPLGLLLPGCPCCEGGSCTQCGFLYYGYQTGQYSDGRLCCTGAIASSVTLRLTNIGPNTSSKVTRGSGASYTKTTASFACSSMAGDYVLPLVRQVYGGSSTQEATCRWTMIVTETCTAGGSANVQPYVYYNSQQTPGDELSFPQYWLFLTQFVWKMAGTYRVQTCSGHPGVESCNVGQTWTSASWKTMVDVGPSFPTMLPKILLSEQRCNPAGIVFDNNIKPWAVQACDVGFGFFGPVETGCEFKVELV